MKVRNIIFWMHLLSGVIVGVVILVMATTGTMLAFRPQILEMVEQSVRKVTLPTSPVERIGLDVIVANVESSQDAKAEFKGITVKSDPTSSVAVSFGKGKTVYVNPYSGEILGKDSKTHHFLEKVEVWHRWLGMEDKKSREIAGSIKDACNLMFLFLIISGFYLWWPRTWNWKTLKMIITFNGQAKGKARDWNWHNVIGFWCAPFLIVITLTGVIMSYTWATNLLYRMTGTQPPPKMERNRDDKKDQNTPKPTSASLDQFFVKAKEQLPNWTSINIRWPEKPGAVTVTIEQPSLPLPRSRAQLTLDYATAEVVKWKPYSEENAGRKLRMLARYLHTGEALGVVGQLISSLASLGAVFLVWTGLSLTWQRFCSWRSRKI